MTQVRKVWNNERGFTLVELLIVVLLMLLVLGIGYGIFSFSLTTFARGENQANVQQNMRIVMQHIEKEVRYAYDVEILDSIDADSLTVAENDLYIFINSDGKLEMRNADDTFILSDTLMDKNFSLTFSKIGSNRLGIEVSTLENPDEKIYTQLTVMNISEDDGMIIGVEEGSAIRITVL